MLIGIHYSFGNFGRVSSIQGNTLIFRGGGGFKLNSSSPSWEDFRNVLNDNLSLLLPEASQPFSVDSNDRQSRQSFDVFNLLQGFLLSLRFHRTLLSQESETRRETEIFSSDTGLMRGVLCIRVPCVPPGHERGHRAASRSRRGTV